MLGLPDPVQACLFDLDGVLTDTASVHTKAWKVMFDDFLRRRADHTAQAFVAFDSDGDYRRFVDGRKREDGVRSFLASRGIEIADGDPDDPPSAETVYGLGNRKNAMFLDTLRADGVRVFDGSRRYLQAASAAGMRIAVVSASANTRAVLEVTGLQQWIDRRVDGVTLRDEHLAGKPAPDSFLYAARLLQAAPGQAAVFEDATAGVQAGRAGGFGFVVGVDRVGHPEQLRRCGADIVVSDLGELL